MSALSEILSSKTRAEIFRLLFSVAENELHIREIQRRSGLNDSTIRQELGKLNRLDLVKARRAGNRVYYRANKENPLYQDIRNMVLKTVGLVDILQSALNDDRIFVAFVYGSVAGGEMKAESDIDLMVIGHLGLRALSGLLSGVSEKAGREINPFVLDPSEFKKRVGKKDHFILTVLDAPKMFIIGNSDDLETMGG